MVHSAHDEGWKGSLHLVPSLYPLCAEITAHAITSAMEERQKARTKTTYSLDINIITTRLSIADYKSVVNSFPYSTSQIGRNTARRASLLHARDLSITDLVKTFNQDQQSFVAECCTHLSGDDGFSSY